MNWINDPLNPEIVEFGYNNSQLSMPEYVPPAEIEHNPDIPHGNVFDTTITSSILNNTRTLRIYTPPSYEQRPDKEYPVIFIHDGIFLFQHAKINNILDNLIAEYRMQQIIAVFVQSIDRNNEYAFESTAQFETFVVEEMLPFIETNYRIIQDPASRAMTGCDFGGLISTQICYNNPEVFGLCAPMSPIYWPKGYEVMRSVLSGPQKSIKFYIDWGKYEFPNMTNGHILKEHFENSGYEFTWNQWNESHNISNWRAHMDNVLEYFFPAVSDVSEMEVPSPFNLMVSPNPVTANTTIAFRLPEKGDAVLSMYDLSGKITGSVMLNELAKGDHQVLLNENNRMGSALKNGVYFIQLKAGLLEETKKVVILK
jgi:enterochelin esterase-like enzyme